ncbi:uncharacterized protein BP01DRAFT_389116 [Aspergillus saccharolyticus JOP 1030-1]|uniref:Uncharacterized protein n=1 Tax=Aspergillus saccharolyticus JOP 1030-1 TaxID=1450539 RepID=A0A319AA32_9EURO|nr:hypothetical protein BP01DRAFT_389116 [Aspergillus saccharolyticus JOP 1030-1]PYH48498.1 hypothetical protein BP01DRAFT_389116 [Aspergillus saccharolyticus JOP 1030-1]
MQAVSGKGTCRPLLASSSSIFLRVIWQAERGVAQVDLEGFLRVLLFFHVNKTTLQQRRDHGETAADPPAKWQLTPLQPAANSRILSSYIGVMVCFLYYHTLGVMP